MNMRCQIQYKVAIINEKYKPIVADEHINLQTQHNILQTSANSSYRNPKSRLDHQTFVLTNE